MNCVKTFASKVVSALTAAGIVVVAALPCAGQQVQHQTITQPGGMPGMPIMTGIKKTTNGVHVSWDGPSGYYQLQQKGALNSGSWQNVGSATIAHQANITTLISNAFFRVSGPAPQYVGSQACVECHQGIHDIEINTRHANAYNTLKNIHQENNPSCLPCHTVGYGLPTGFTPARMQLAGVQCENCHGPAGNHAANEFDFTVRPRVDIAAQVCGGCHTGSHQPTYDEWELSGHGEVTEENMNANSCGRCHIGSARLAMVMNKPVPTNDTSVAVVCVVCHDPHANHVFTNVISGVVYTNQLLNPLSSTNDYFLTTSAVFSNVYNANINICAQCHNHRGATWTSNSRAPHHSPQYNILLATVGVLPSNALPGRPGGHAYIEKQCVSCHMQTEEFVDGAHPANTGHKFEVESYNSCLPCHPTNPQGLAALVQFSISNQVQQVKSYLDIWALTKAPEVLRTNYWTDAWEYTIPGDLSMGTAGPTASQQTNLIPASIRMARYNLYLALYDGSYGVHNPHYTTNLIGTARSWVTQELSK